MTPTEAEALLDRALTRRFGNWDIDASSAAEELAPVVAQIVAAERARWVEWLADVGYGIDFTRHPHPPCTPREVAEVYAEREPIDNLDRNAGETSTEVHEWVIAQNTGWEQQ